MARAEPGISLKEIVILYHQYSAEQLDYNAMREVAEQLVIDGLLSVQCTDLTRRYFPVVKKKPAGKMHEVLARCEELEDQLDKMHDIVGTYTLGLSEVLAERDEIMTKYREAVRELTVARQQLECAGEQMQMEGTD